VNDPFSDGLAMLVVEDDDALRDSMHEYMVMDGFAVDSVGTVDEAARCLEERRPAVLILDLMLHDRRAEPLLAKLKARGDEAPVTVLVSAALDAREIAKRYDVPLLPKPFDLEDLSELVAELVARRSSVPVAV
jgi:DNA-binding NtrC family response regulator